MSCNGLGSILSFLTPRRVLILFVSSNLLFMGVDVSLAHMYNVFSNYWEWVPIAYSMTAGLVALVYGLKHPDRFTRALYGALLFLGFLMGVYGLYLHVHHTVVDALSLKGLVYAAPIAAPLSYSGVSLAGLVADDWFWSKTPWNKKQSLFLLAGGGFLGNLCLAALDHARNGFFHDAEWFSVFAAAFGTVVLLWAGLRRKPLTREQAITVAFALGLEVCTGVAGFLYHLRAVTHGTMPTLVENIVYGAPLFAPLLFADIAALGVLALLMDEHAERWHFQSGLQGDGAGRT